MPTAKKMHYLATHPMAHQEFLRTGRLPQERVPKSPLIDLLSKLGPRDLGRIEGLTIDQRLGYSGQRTFRFGPQALQWLTPRTGLYGRQTAPSESWQDRRFNRPLYLEDLQACCTRFPPQILDSYPSLRRPTPSTSSKALASSPP